MMKISLSKFFLFNLIVSGFLLCIIGSSSGYVYGQENLPYMDDFNTNNGWSFGSNTTTVWGVASATGNPGNSMYVSMNGGQSNTYAANSVTTAMKSFALPASQNLAFVQFDVKMRGEGTTTLYDYLNVWVLPAGTAVTAGTLIETQNLGGALLLSKYNKINVADSSTWFSHALPVPLAYNNTNIDLYFEFRSDGSTQNKPAPAIDNFKFFVPNCGAIADLSASVVTENSAFLNFTPSNASQYLVYVNGLYHSTITAPSTLTGLNTNSPYAITVKGLCAQNDTSVVSNTVAFTTLCTAVTAFTEDFDSYAASTMVSCWGKVGATGTVQTSSSYPTSGSRTFYIYTNTAGANAMAHFRPVSNLGAGTHSLTFKARTSATYLGTIAEVGYLSNPSDQSSFVALQAITMTATHQDYTITPPAGTPGQVLAIRTTGNMTANYIYMDDVAWGPSPGCQAPVGMTISNVTHNSATVSWTAPSPAPLSYIVYANGYYYTTTNQTSLVVQAFNEMSPGTVSLASVCSAQDTSAFLTPVSFNTVCSAVTSFMQDWGTSGTALPACFEKVGGTGTTSIATTNAIAGNRLSISAKGMLRLRSVSNLGAGTHELKFSARPSTSIAATPVLYVGYLTDTQNANSFVKTDSILFPPSDISYQDYTFTFPVGVTSLNMAIQAGVNVGTTTNSIILVDNMSWDVIPTCSQPTNVTVTDIVYNGATVHWTVPSPAPAQYRVYVNGNLMGTTAADSLIVTGIGSNMTHSIQVAGYCSVNDISPLTFGVNITTPCAPVTTFFEDFGTSGTAFPTCFAKVGTTGTATIATTNSVSGLRLNLTTKGVARMRAVSNMGAGTNRLRFSARTSASVVANAVLYVGYVTDENNYASFVKVDSVIFPSANTTYNEYYVTFPAGLNEMYMAMQSGVNVGTTTNSSILIDNVYWEALPACLAPNAITISNITHNSATANWAVPSPAPANYLVYVNNVYYGTSAVDSLNITGLNDDATYTVTVRGLCSAQDTSVISNVATFKTFCTPVSDFYEDFGPSGTAIPTCFAKVGATGTTTVTTTNAISGSRLLISVAGTFKLRDVNNMGAGTHRLRLYARPSSTVLSAVQPVLYVGYVVDANDPTTFVQLDSLILPPNSTAYQTYTFAYPAGLTSTHLAIKGGKNVGTTTNSLILVDDIYWEAVPNCFAPQNVQVSNITNTTADYAFTASTSAPASYLMYVNGAYHATVSASTGTITGLTPGLNNQLSVASLCAAQDTSVFTLPVSFYTDCDTVSQFYQGMENNGAVLPVCFTKVGTTGTTTVTTANTNSGTYKLNLGADFVLKLNEVNNLGAGTHQLRFSFRPTTSGNVGNKFYIGYLTNPTDRTSFVKLDSVVETSGVAAHKIHVYAPPAGVYTPHLTIRNGYRTGTTWSTVILDDIYWEPIPVCGGIYTAPSVVANYNTAAVTWSTANTASNVFLVYQDGILVDTAYTNSAVLTNLAATTSYNVSVQAVCGSDSTLVSPSAAFTTLCAPTAIPALGLCEDFTNGLGCWTVNNNNGDGDTWVAYQSQVRMYTSLNYGVNDDYLISPNIILGANQALKFSYKTNNNTEPEEMNVVLSTTGTAPSDFTHTLISNMNFASLNYLDTVVDLSAFAGQNIYIAFHIPMSGTDGSYVYIDDVCIKECMPNAGNDQTLNYCISGGSVDLANVVTLADNTGSFSSSDALVTAAMSGTVLTYSALPAGTYNVDYIVSGLCGFDTLTVAVDVQTPISLGNDLTLAACKNDNQMDLIAAGNITLMNGVFEAGSPFYAGAINNGIFNFSALSAGVYTFDYLVSAACNDDTLGFAITIHDNAFAGADASAQVCKNQPISLLQFVDPNGQANGVWYDAAGQTINPSNVVAPNNGGDANYYYVVNSANCGFDTSVVTLQVNATCDYLSVEQLNFDNASVYPNPTTGVVTVSLANNYNGFKFTVMDINGRVIEQSQGLVQTTSFQVNLAAFEDGVYLIQLANDDASKVFRIVKK